ncbi:hypothetical protein BDF21DRAFT_405103 [Thamnidium elegans]|nr:hypothetical protein BDF21DRAFT_405103 [Thamnidium elegans]
MLRNIFDEILQQLCTPAPQQHVSSTAVFCQRPAGDEAGPSTYLPLLPTENVQKTEEPLETTQKLEYHTCTVTLNSIIRQDLPQNFPANGQYTIFCTFTFRRDNGFGCSAERVEKLLGILLKVHLAPIRNQTYAAFVESKKKTEAQNICNGRIYEETNIRLGDHRRMIIRDEYYKIKKYESKNTK